jgi:hypothetical protein
MSKQQATSSTITRKVVIFSGGTMVHVRPHFSLCAPAYGKVGDTLTFELNKLSALTRAISPESAFWVDHIKTKMAGGDEVETNEDLTTKLDEVLLDRNVKAIVMAAAVCDFEPDGISYGKDFGRLDSQFGYKLQLKPSEKIIDRIKKVRPDIILATFKTTSDESQETLQYKATNNLERCGSDIVLGNDIKRKYNMLVTSTSCESFGDRETCVYNLARAVTDAIIIHK